MLSSTVCLTNESFKRSIESLYYCKAQDVNKHVSHTNSSQQYRLIDLTYVVSVNQHDHHVYEHAEDHRSGELCNFPETLYYGHVVMKAHLVFGTLLRKQFLVLVNFINVRILQSCLLMQFFVLTRIPVDTDGVFTSSIHKVIHMCVITSASVWGQFVVIY